MKIKILAILLLLTLFLSACKNLGNRPDGTEHPSGNGGFGNIASDESSYGDSLDSAVFPQRL